MLTPSIPKTIHETWRSSFTARTLLLLSALVVPACAVASDDDAPSDDDDEGIGQSSSELSLPGSWTPPPDVLSAGAKQYVGYDDAGPWKGAAGCGGSLLAGTRQLGDYVRANFPGRVSSYGGYSCRQNTANKSKTSVHGTGRALDIFVPLTGGKADNTKGDEVANWLVRNAAAIGVQYIIWDRASWQGSLSGNKLQGYTGPHPHHDHLHVELTIDGALRRTPFFTGGAAAPAPPPAGGGGGGGGVAGNGGCGVEGDGKLYCTNRDNVALRAAPNGGAAVVNTIRTTSSWFTCWGTGEPHAGGNSTWYFTLGDDNGNWGWVPGVSLNTPDAFDANPTAHGLKACGAPAPAAGNASCGVRGDGKLHCTNRDNAPLRSAANGGAGIVNTLRTTSSWFTCWAPGALHAGGNSTWYFTVGDDNGNWGWIPAVLMHTSSAFDANPSAHGLKRCN